MFQFFHTVRPFGKAWEAGPVATVRDEPHRGGWQRVVDADALGPASVCRTAVEVPGEEPMVVWRTTSGEVCVLADRCPHQWSSLAAEGEVDGDELVCTAHGWRFGTDGAGSKRAMSGRDDPKAPVAAYESREVDGGVWVRRSAR